MGLQRFRHDQAAADAFRLDELRGPAQVWQWADSDDGSTCGSPNTQRGMLTRMVEMNCSPWPPIHIAPHGWSATVSSHGLPPLLCCFFGSLSIELLTLSLWIPDLKISTVPKATWIDLTTWKYGTRKKNTALAFQDLFSLQIWKIRPFYYQNENT